MEPFGLPLPASKTVPLSSAVPQSPLVNMHCRLSWCLFFIHLFCFVFLSGLLYIPLFKNKLQLAWASISLCLIELSYVGGSVKCPFSCLGSLPPSNPCIPFQWIEPRFSCVCVKHCTTEIHPPAILAPVSFWSSKGRTQDLSTLDNSLPLCHTSGSGLWVHVPPRPLAKCPGWDKMLGSQFMLLA